MAPRLQSTWRLLVFLILVLPAAAQTPPGAAELQAYRGLHAAAAKGDVAEIETLVKSGASIDARDGRARTPLHVAAFMGKPDAARTLMCLGADANALEAQKYDIVTIAAVADDVPMLKVALDVGCKAGNITSPYYGTALIAAAHLGHDEVVRTLIAAKAPLDHVNNLGWTALIESIVLGDGGKNHTDTLDALVKARADVNLPDRSGFSPLQLAKVRGYGEMARILEAAGAK
ncbi:MAG TPA: ankyrin repeat domain-containing protein [Burkholderiales bacterium]|nr:ankyrin repeat domain-containing protein [Burkholderiales bacterium]